MDGLQFLDHGITPSVVIHYLNVNRTLSRPYEAHAPLIVNTGAMLFFPIALQGFQPITRRGSQIAQIVRRV
jgi:hypothetical protein